MPRETPALPVVAQGPPFFPGAAYQLLSLLLLDSSGNCFRARDAAPRLRAGSPPASNFMEVNAL